MKISEQWLREWVDPPLSTEELGEQLTMAGFEVDAVESCEPTFKNVIVARVEQSSPHPDADRLSICELNTGSETVTVVCGAPDIGIGSCYALAMPGATMPDGSEIALIRLKGINSEGMLCSGDELGLTGDSDRLFEIQKDAEPGTNLADYLGLEDHVFDLSLTPNRGDAFSVAGIAREIGVLNNLSVKQTETKTAEVKTNQTRNVSLHAAAACPRYVGRIISGIDVTKRAPDEILERLRRSDLRSINIVVDLTNYVMLELGQPMHAFDNNKLQGEIVIRMSAAGEALTLLDGQHVHLKENNLLITDEAGPVALAGIMGGLDSAVSDTSHDLFLESAYFTPEAIAGRARGHGLHTDASLRYERGVDFTLQERALERLTLLILKYCGGNAGPLVIAEDTSNIPVRPPVNLELMKISHLLGIEIKADTVKQILEQLGFYLTEKPTGFIVKVPSFRFDIGIEADLIEEVARIYGYDKMPSTPPLANLRMPGDSGDSCLPELQQALMNRGYHEIISYSFVDKTRQEKILGEINPIPLLNPISSDLGVMRASLIPGLLDTLAYNHKRQQERVRLFECGRVFRNDGEIRQDIMIGGIISGNIFLKQWDKEDIPSDIYYIKGDIEALVQLGMGEQDIDYRAFKHHALHLGQSAQIFINNQLIGYAGALHPSLMKEYDLVHPAFIFELDLLSISSKNRLKFTKISKFPTVKRDISLLIDREIPVARVMKCIKSEAKALLTNLELFDLYRGEGIDIEKKSLALGLTFQTSSSTLREEEVEGVMRSILAALYSEFGATLRE